MDSHFQIQHQEFKANARSESGSAFTIRSVPRPYRLDFAATNAPGEILSQEILTQKAPLLLIDQNVRQLYFNNIPALDQVPTMEVAATEEVKGIDTVLSIIDFLERECATKTSMLYVVGGGILQDLGAFSCAMYKRGLPWTFVPTTLLAQGDSCVGAKTALNHKCTKNLLGLFSAPRRILIDTGYLKTLPENDVLSGAGEIFRLCITGGQDFLDVFIEELPAFLRGESRAALRLISTSLSAKRAVVECDEFELDLRRSMNYGHSFGHALEALSSYRIPHGIGVTIGILVENQIAHARGVFPLDERDHLFELGRQIIPAQARATFASTAMDGVIELLRRDKKTEGAILKLATLERIGQMRFIDFHLDASGERELCTAVNTVLASLLPPS